MQALVGAAWVVAAVKAMPQAPALGTWPTRRTPNWSARWPKNWAPLLPGRSAEGESRYAAELTAVDPDCHWYAVLTGPFAYDLRGEALWAGDLLGTGGVVQLAPRDGAGRTGSFSIYLGAPLAQGEFDMSRTTPGGIMVSVPEVAARSSPGTARITVARPNRVEGEFDADVANLEQGVVHLSGGFVWTPGCPNR